MKDGVRRVSVNYEWEMGGLQYLTSMFVFSNFYSKVKPIFNALAPSNINKYIIMYILKYIIITIIIIIIIYLGYNSY